MIKNVFSTEIHWQNFSKTKNQSSKIIKIRVWYLLLLNIWLLLAKIPLFTEDWVLGSVSIQFWIFSDISYFPKIQRVNYFGNSWENLYAESIVLDIKSCNFYGQPNMYWSAVNCQNIMTSFVWSYQSIKLLTL